MCPTSSEGEFLLFLTLHQLILSYIWSLAVQIGVVWYLLICNPRQWHPTLVLLPGKSHGRRSLVGCSPWGREGLDTTELLHFPFSLSCIGEGNGNPFQCSCLENSRDGGAWWRSEERRVGKECRS